MQKRSFSPSLRPTIEQTVSPTFIEENDRTWPTISPADEPISASVTVGRVWMVLDIVTEALQDDALRAIQVAITGAHGHMGPYYSLHGMFPCMQIS